MTALTNLTNLHPLRVLQRGNDRSYKLPGHTDPTRCPCLELRAAPSQCESPLLEHHRRRQLRPHHLGHHWKSLVQRPHCTQILRDPFKVARTLQLLRRVERPMTALTNLTNLHPLRVLQRGNDRSYKL